jgi:plasmid stabilization system protein ParE
MRFTVGISPQPGQDLEDIVFFITAREQDAKPAERFASALVDEAKELADFPHRGKVFQRSRGKLVELKKHVLRTVTSEIIIDAQSIAT